ncbi:hypothetical protein HKX48_005680, partial [Thoreauomyces humboldtii]
MTRLALTVLAAMPLIAQAHMMISDPSVWGHSDDNLETPLNRDTPNWFCHGKKKSDAAGQFAITAGKPMNLNVVCGEANSNPSRAASICTDTSAFHGGGGCGLSIAYKGDNPSINDFTMFSMNANCPTLNVDHSVSFNVPDNLPECDDCICSWTWIPNPDDSNSEMYMDCFNCKVLSQHKGAITGGIQLKDHLWAVPGQPTDNGDGSNRPMYKKVLPNGALPITVNGAVAPAPAPVPTPKTP